MYDTTTGGLPYPPLPPENGEIVFSVAWSKSGSVLAVLFRLAVIQFAIAATLVACSAARAPGPAGPGTVSQAWRYHTPAAGYLNNYSYYAAAPGLLVTAESDAHGSLNKIDAIDPATGRIKWMSHTGDQTLTAIGATRQVIVASGGSGSGSNDLWAFSASNGSAIWVRDLQGDGSAIGVADGRVVVVGTDYLRELSAATGAPIWEYPFPSDCRSPQSGSVPLESADDEVTAVLLECPQGKTRLTVTNTTTGQKVWSRVIALNVDWSSYTGPFYINVAGSDVVLSRNGSLTVFSSSGKPLLFQETDPGGEAWAAASGRDVLIAFEDQSGRTVAEKIDGQDGKIIRAANFPYVISSAYFTGNEAYLIVRLPAPLLPAGMVITSLDTDSASLAAMPFAQSLTAGNGLIFLTSSTWIDAYSTAPTARGATFLQGSRPGPWPGACALLSAARLSAIEQAPYTQAETTHLAGGLPAASECDYTPGNPAKPFVTVSVRWVAASDRMAAELLADEADGWTEVPGIGAQAYHWSETCALKTCVSDEIMLREGSVIVEVKADLSARAITEAVAAQLRQETDRSR